MTDSTTPSDIEQLPQAWRDLWRAHTVLPDSVASDELTIFVRAGGRDAAHLAVKRALHAMFPAAYQYLDEAYGNLSSAPELVREGVSERHVDRLFEVAWTGNKVDAWVSAPVFVVPEAAALFAAWITAQLDHASQYASRTFVQAPGIVVDESPAMAAKLDTQALDARRLGVVEEIGRSPEEERMLSEARTAPTRPLRYLEGYQIPGNRLVIDLHPMRSGKRDRIAVVVSTSAEAIASDRGMTLTGAPGEGFAPDEICVAGDLLTCAAPVTYLTEYAPGVTDFREGFSVTLEEGQAGAVRHAVAQLRRVLASYRAAVDYLQPWLSGFQPSPWYVEEPLFHLVAARVLDGAEPASAMAAADQRGTHKLPAEARSRVDDPTLWATVDRAAGPPSP
ncbi:hypothetical protein [Achromobacter spanius]|uniref:hypothetical protein n=1 Tax=Achromobacter spanius TaxID=217203 RepID=UPI0037F6690D